MQEAIPVEDLREDPRQELIADVREGLGSRPKVLPPRWFYDARGSELFEAITELPEYYQTRTEMGILRQHAAALTLFNSPEAVVEFGAGSCAKSRLIIEAARRQGSLRWFVPLDLEDALLQQIGADLTEEFPGLWVQGVVGDFNRDLERIQRLGRQMIVFLGSTIGNLDEAARGHFLRSVRALMIPGDSFLLGIDLVKDEGDLVRAYDDAQGITAEFNLNLLRRLNRELDANFDLSAFQHVALWNREESRIEMHLRAEGAQEVVIPGASLEVHFEDGETLRTEISVKFSREAVEASLTQAGLRLERWLTDDRGRFALALAAPSIEGDAIEGDSSLRSSRR